MKKCLACLIILLACISLRAQTVPTDAARRLAEVEKEILSIEEKLWAAYSTLPDLRKQFTENHPKIKATQAQITKLNETLVVLNLEKKNLLSQRLAKPLPSNQIELLQMIVIQNERIIGLLEILTKNRSF